MIAALTLAIGFLAGYALRMRRERKRLTAGQIVARQRAVGRAIMAKRERETAENVRRIVSAVEERDRGNQ